MKAFARCPVCDGDLATKPVAKLLRGGTDTAAVEVHTEVCLRCGERLYTPEQVRRFDEIRAKLERGETDEFPAVGCSFEVA